MFNETILSVVIQMSSTDELNLVSELCYEKKKLLNNFEFVFVKSNSDKFTPVNIEATIENKFRDFQIISRVIENIDNSKVCEYASSPYIYLHDTNRFVFNSNKSVSQISNMEEFIQNMILLDKIMKLFEEYEYAKRNFRNFVIEHSLEVLDEIIEGSDILNCQLNTRKIADFLRTYPLFYAMIPSDIDRDKVWLDFVTIKLNSIFETNYGPKVIASLTSHPLRIGTVHLVIDTILNQSLKADRVLLYLSKLQFLNMNDDLPNELIELSEKGGLEIVWCDEDLRSHKKYYYAMKDFPEDLIILLDDDIRYGNDLFKKLYDSYCRFPNCVSATRTHPILFDDGKIIPYRFWKHKDDRAIKFPSRALLTTSGAGSLFPPNSLHKEVFNYKNIFKSCINADDLWLYVMQIMNNTSTVLIEKTQDIKEIEGTNTSRLYNFNRIQNDIQLKQILSYYDNYFGDDDTLTSRIYNDYLILEEKGIK